MDLRRLTALSVSLCMVSGLILGGCTAAEETPVSTSVSDSEITSSFDSGSVSNIVINAHFTEDVADSEFDGQYTRKDTVSVTYEADILGGTLPQKVSKDIVYCFSGSTCLWEKISETTTACEVDNSALIWSSWKAESLSSGDISRLFGGEVSDDDTGGLYFRFLKKMGLFAFNLSNEKNTSSERFFTTTGTGAKLVWVSGNGIVEKSVKITNGYVTDSGNLFLDFGAGGDAIWVNLNTDAVRISEQEFDVATGAEVSGSKVYIDSLPIFEVTTDSIENGEWKQITGLKEGNLSPSLRWEPVDGATKYAVIMLDTTTTNWLCWYLITDKTTLSEGEYTGKEDYIGPYPPGTHTYEIYVIALKGEPQELNYPLDASSGAIDLKMNSLNLDSDGNFGNVIAYGTIKASYTAAELYYDYR